MKTFLIKPNKGGYKISDGTMLNRKTAVCATPEQARVLNNIFMRYSEIVVREISVNENRAVNNCRIRWIAIWDGKVEIGYEGELQTTGKAELGKLYFDNPEELEAELCSFL